MSSSGSKSLVILGATGSIGDSVIDIVSRHPNLFKVFAISGHSNIKKLILLCEKVKPEYVIITNKTLFGELEAEISKLKIKINVLAGLDELNHICQMPEVDMVVAGIVGSAGMESALASVKAGKDLLLANKEALVMAGDLVMKAAKENHANIIPLDSEHNAIYQCLPDEYQVGNQPCNVEKIILTASGGPFWNRDYSTFGKITPQQACAHPNWDMGRKISVDSATLMNKGLEIIEAHWLFDMAVDRIDVNVHPQSIIHSMVCFDDSSVIAQLGEPDMRIPIAYGLGLRQRIKSGANLIDLISSQDLQFFAPDYKKFPCLALAQEAIKLGGTAMAVLNIVNEVSVDAFLNEKISFKSIANINHEVMESMKIEEVKEVEQLNELSKEIKSIAHKKLTKSGQLYA